MKALLAAAVAVLLPISVAHAQETPRYEVESHCDAVASVGGSFSNTMYNSCIDMEQQAYDSIKRRWSSLPAETQGHCNSVATVGGSGSYSMLESCVQMEASAASNRSEFSFD